MIPATDPTDTPISFGLATSVLRERNMLEIFHLRRQVNTGLGTHDAYEDAIERLHAHSRLNDAEARAILEKQGIFICRE